MALKYKIIEAGDTGQLDFRVREAIARGWEPIGGVAVQTMARDYSLFYQSMVKGRLVKVTGDVTVSNEVPVHVNNR